MSLESVERAVLLVVGDDTLAGTVFHDQVNGKELDKVFGVVAQRLAIESVQKGVASPVRSGAAAVRLTTLSILLRLTTEGSLVAARQLAQNL